MRLRLFAALASAATLLVPDSVRALKLQSHHMHNILVPGQSMEEVIDLVQLGKESEDHELKKVLHKQERAKQLADRKFKPQAVQDHENFLDA